MAEEKGNPKALLPILVFVLLYLGIGVYFEYGLGMSMGFYSIPVVAVFLVALMVACLQNRKVKFNDKMKIMAKGVGEPNLMTMILIFLVAGTFVGIVGRSSAESVAYFVLTYIPPEFSVLVIFLVAAFVSVSMGTSVGTITLLTPIALAVSSSTGFDAALCVATVIGGAMFGDNLSFISDTTIAACQGQGCQMKDKFRENFKIALPAAIVTCILILVVSFNSTLGPIVIGEYDLLKIIPYVLVLAGGIIGFNVFAVLIVGILSGAIIMLGTGSVDFVGMIENIGGGVSGMFETAMVAILVSMICALINEYGGFEAVLSFIRRNFKNKTGGELGIGILVSAMDVSTANNTVAIIMSNPIASSISEDYGISKRKTASILDTFSCVVQGILPYGAQMLVALSAAITAGVSLSAFSVIPNMFYPFMLLIASLIFIVIDGRKGADKELN